MGSVVRRLFLPLAWLSVLGGGVFILLYLVPETQSLTSDTVVLGALVPFGIVLWLLAILGFLVGSPGWGRLFAIVPLAALVVQIDWTRAYWPRSVEPPSGPTLRVMASNLDHGRADPGPTAAAILAADPDVLVLLEVDRPLLESPALAEALASYPHRHGEPAERDGAAGGGAAASMVFARTPLTHLDTIDSGFDQYVLQVDAHGTPLTLVAAHPLSMARGGHVWEYEGNLLRRAISPHLAEPLVVIGDLNATPEHLTLRRLTELGLSIGAQEAGAGWQPTFDAGVAWLPPIVATDHVLTNDRVSTTSFHTVPIPGSAHHAIVADLAVR